MLAEFEPDIAEWVLIPADNGRFEIEVNGKMIFNKKDVRRHAEPDEIRQALQSMLQELNE